MLYVTTGEFEPFDGDIDNVFYGNFEEEWFSIDFVKQMVMEIDKSKVISASCIQSPVLGAITFERLSGGVKTLIMLYCMPELKQWASACGENCMRLLFQIGAMHDIHVKFSHIPDRESIPEDACAIFEDTGTAVQNRHEFMLELIYDLDRTRRR